VDWWFAYKFSSSAFPSEDGDPARACPFGGQVRHGDDFDFSQQYVVASKGSPQLVDGQGLIGTSLSDPLGATFSQIYNGAYYFVVWNDQFKGAPKLACGADCDGPWGHSKGMLAWNDAGEGMVLQVTTPSWPGAGSARTPRSGDGDTLGCVDDDDVEFSQDFFALKLTKDDVVEVLKALGNASVVTDPTNTQIVNNGGPADISGLVSALGAQSASTSATRVVLSSGVQLISKPSKLHVPPWQMVSAELGGIPLRVANWWTAPAIPDTDASTKIDCWDSTLGTPGPVVSAAAGQWDGKRIGLKGGASPDSNHGKLGVSTDGTHTYAIFGDMNQQGALTGNCASSQNGRGGMFFVVDNAPLAGSVAKLLTDPGGGAAPVATAAVPTSKTGH
jgi:hypothetical protein